MICTSMNIWNFFVSLCMHMSFCIIKFWCNYVPYGKDSVMFKNWEKIKTWCFCFFKSANWVLWQPQTAFYIIHDTYISFCHFYKISKFKIYLPILPYLFVGYEISEDDVIAIARLRGHSLRSYNIPHCCICTVEEEDHIAWVSHGCYPPEFPQKVRWCR